MHAFDPRLRAPLPEPFAHGQSNPASTSPAPSPDLRYRPVGYWGDGAPLQLQWQAGASPVVSTATWGTPILDMRTDLQTVTSEDDQAAPLNRTAGAQLFVEISGLSANHYGLNVYAIHWAHPTFARSLRQVTPGIDVTAQVDTGLDAALLCFYPPGGAYYVRFWQLQLRFDFVPIGGGIPAPVPMISVQGAMY